MEQIRKKDKSASKKFWNNVKLLSSKNYIHQKFLIDEEGKHLEGEHALEHIHRVISEKFRAIVVGKPAPKTSAPHKISEREIRLSNLDGKKGFPQTAVGPDGIPMQLIKLLGPKSKESFIRAIDKVIQTKEIPEDWLERGIDI